jgi:hypothetical protein
MTSVLEISDAFMLYFLLAKFTCKIVVPILRILKPKAILSTFENTHSDGNFYTHEKDGATSGSGASF